MSGLKNFLDRRAEGIARDKSKTEDIAAEKEDVVAANPNLSDDEFWAISNQFLKDSKHSDKSPVEILQAILEGYTPLKIQQFAKRYEELNK